MSEIYRFRLGEIYSEVLVRVVGERRAVFEVSCLGEIFSTSRDLRSRPSWSYVPEVVREAKEAINSFAVSAA